MSALSDGELGGDQQIWIRLPPENIAAIPRGRIEDSVFHSSPSPPKNGLENTTIFWIGAGISEDGCRLLESLVRRQLIHHRPINFLAAAYDGVMGDHPAWFPVEVYATPLAWEHHKDDIIKYLFGKQRSAKEDTA